MGWVEDVSWPVQENGRPWASHFLPWAWPLEDWEPWDEGEGLQNCQGSQSPSVMFSIIPEMEFYIIL